MKLITDAIYQTGKASGTFDPRYTCDSDNSSPELHWDDPPEGTRSFAVIAEDLAIRVNGNPPLTHWLVYAIPAEIRHLPAGIPPQDTLPNGIRQGINALRKLGYSGPCPPPGEAAHRYMFRLYALSAVPEISSRATREQLLAVIQPLVLATCEVIGSYQRSYRETA